MTSGITVVIAISTAAAILLVTFLVSRLVRTVVDTSGAAPERSWFPRMVGRRWWARQTAVGPPVFQPIAAPSRGVEPSKAPAVEAPREQEPALAATQAAPPVEPETPSYRQVGDEVTAILAAAEQAAVQIREAAVQEAERTSSAAKQEAVAIAAEAQSRRAEADRYSEETRASADTYADETRRRADDEAERAVSQAEERARQIRADADQKASEVEAEAARRRDALERGLEGLEERVESMLGAFRRGTSELEELLRDDRSSGTEEDGGKEQEALDEALNANVSRAR
jgi:hypothetical protein